MALVFLEYTSIRYASQNMPALGKNIARIANAVPCHSLLKSHYECWDCDTKCKIRPHNKDSMHYGGFKLTCLVNTVYSNTGYIVPIFCFFAILQWIAPEPFWGVLCTRVFTPRSPSDGQGGPLKCTQLSSQRIVFWNASWLNISGAWGRLECPRKLRNKFLR